MKRYFMIIIIGAMVMLMLGCGGDAASEENLLNDIIVPQENNVNAAAVSQETDNQPARNDSETTVSETEKPETDAKEETQESEPSFYGTWTVKDYQPGKVTALSAEEMETFKGMTVTYQADAVLQNGQNMNLSDFEYEYETYTEQSFIEAYRANLGEWWSEKEKVTGVSITPSDGFFGSQFFVADENTIWVFYEGVVFLARK